MYTFSMPGRSKWEGGDAPPPPVATPLVNTPLLHFFKVESCMGHIERELQALVITLSELSAILLLRPLGAALDGPNITSFIKHGMFCNDI